MVVVLAIILADLIVVLLFIYHYRQELGLTVNGSNDMPVLRKKPDANKAVRDSAADDQTKSDQLVPREGAARNRTVRGRRRNA